MTNKTQLTLPSDREMVITRVFDAPRDLVWQAWTQCEHLVHWWGPQGWTLPVCEMDFREGGSWLYCMAGPDDMRSCGKTVFHSIDAPNQFTAEDLFVDEAGNPMPDMPVASFTIEFIAQGDQTLVKNTTVYPSQADRDAVIEMGMEQGMDDTLNRLAAYLPTLQ